MKDFKQIITSMINFTKVDWMQALYSVISSGADLVSRIGSATQDYLTTYIGVQTFDNAGQETTDAVRAGNALVPLITKVNEVRNAISQITTHQVSHRIELVRPINIRLLTNFTEIMISVSDQEISVRSEALVAGHSGSVVDFNAFLSGFIQSDASNVRLCNGANVYYKAANGNMELQRTRFAFPVLYRRAKAQADGSLYFKEKKAFIELSIGAQDTSNNIVTLYLGDYPVINRYRWQLGSMSWDDLCNTLLVFIPNLNSVMRDLMNSYLDNNTTWTPPTTIRVGAFTSSNVEALQSTYEFCNMISMQESGGTKWYIMDEFRKIVQINDFKDVSNIKSIADNYLPTMLY